MTEDRKAILEKEKSVNIPDVDRKMNSPETEEYLYMICTNTKLDVTSVFELSHGNVNSSVVGIREMFQKALLANAVNVIVMHNHPSGYCTPSKEDVAVTKRMIEAGRLIGAEVLDHLIIGNDKFCSLKEKGYL